MKRLLAFFVVGCFAFALSFFGEFDLLSNDKISKVCFVTKNCVEAEEVVQSGNQLYYTFDLETAKQKYKEFKNIDGLILYFENASPNEIFSYYHAESFKGGEVEGMETYYGYTPYFDGFFYQNNKKVNMQVAVQENQIIVGFPAILIGF